MSPCRLGACVLLFAVVTLHVEKRLFGGATCVLWQQAALQERTDFFISSDMREGLRGNKSSAAETHLHTHRWAGVGRWVNKAAVFAHQRGTASKDTTAMHTLISEWHLTELQQTGNEWALCFFHQRLHFSIHPHPWLCEYLVFPVVTSYHRRQPVPCAAAVMGLRGRMGAMWDDKPISSLKKNTWRLKFPSPETGNNKTIELLVCYW